MPKIKTKQIPQKEPFRSILNLLEFIDRDKKIRGLTFGQIFYALKKPDEKNNPALIENGKNQEFFKNKKNISNPSEFIDLYKKIKDGHTIRQPKVIRSIPLKQRLNDHLLLMHDRGFISVDSTKKQKIYYLSHMYLREMEIDTIKMKLTTHSNSETLHGNHIIEVFLSALIERKSKGPHKGIDAGNIKKSFIVYGLSIEFLYTLSAADVEKILSAFVSIKKGMSLLKEVKKKNSKVELDDYLNLSIEDQLFNNEIGFYYGDYASPEFKEPEEK